MDFEQIDTVLGDSIEKHDIVKEDGYHWQILSEADDEGDLLTFPAYNLDTGDEDDLVIDPDGPYDLYRSY